MSLLADYNMPFTIALGVVLLLSLLQFVGIGDLFGSDADLDLDLDLDVDLDVDVDGHIVGDTHSGGDAGIAGAVTTLLGIGRVPFFIWLIVLTMLFALIGFGIQAFSASLIGAPLYSWLAGVISAGVSLPATGVVVRPLARIIPQDETSAVPLNALVGRRAKITIGTAKRGSPARAQVKDMHGQSHYVMVEPHVDNNEIREGDEVLLVRRQDQIFIGRALEDRPLAPIT